MRHHDEVFLILGVKQEIRADRALGALHPVKLLDRGNVVVSKAEGGHKTEIIKMRLRDVSVIRFEKVRARQTKADKKPRSERDYGEDRHIASEAVFYFSCC